MGLEHAWSDHGRLTDIEIGFNESEKAFRESKNALVESKNAILETDFASNGPRTTSLEAKTLSSKPILLPTDRARLHWKQKRYPRNRFCFQRTARDFVGSKNDNNESEIGFAPLNSVSSKAIRLRRNQVRSARKQIRSHGSTTEN
jgi:hypothetical protein